MGGAVVSEDVWVHPELRSWTSAINDVLTGGARLQLGVAAMFLVAGAMLLSSSRREGTVDKD